MPVVPCVSSVLYQPAEEQHWSTIEGYMTNTFLQDLEGDGDNGVSSSGGSRLWPKPQRSWLWPPSYTLRSPPSLPGLLPAAVTCCVAQIHTQSLGSKELGQLLNNLLISQC